MTSAAYSSSEHSHLVDGRSLCPNLALFKELMALFTVDPERGNFNYAPQQEPSQTLFRKPRNTSSESQVRNTEKEEFPHLGVGVDANAKQASNGFGV